MCSSKSALANNSPASHVTICHCVICNGIQVAYGVLLDYFYVAPLNVKTSLDTLNVKTSLDTLNVKITLNVKNQRNVKKAGPLNVKKYQR